MFESKAVQWASWIITALIVTVLAVWAIQILLLVLGVVLAAVILAVVCALACTAYWYVLDYLSPVQRVHASVISRRSTEWFVACPRSTAESLWVNFYSLAKGSRHYSHRCAPGDKNPATEITGGVDYLVTFVFDSRTMEFSVPASIFDVAAQSVTGLLVYQGRRLIDFQPELEIEEPLPAGELTAGE